jgi:imidazolonepropionase-like amidohydrolase
VEALHLAGPVIVDDRVVLDEAWVEAGVVRFAPTPGASYTDLAGFAVPGLVDVHCHVGLDSGGIVDDNLALKQATIDRDAGALLIREPGSPTDTHFLDDVPTAPRIVRSGRFIARPKRYIRGYAREVEIADLPAAVAEEARAGDGWVKLIADWIDRDAGDLTPLWPREALAEAIAAAHAEGARVTAHTFATESIDDLLDAGIDCLEHGTGMTPEHMERAAALGVAVAPTLLQVGNFGAFAAQGEAKFPRYAARMRHMFERRHEQAHQMWEAGLQLLVGTDAGGEVGHGEVAFECAELVRAGIPPSDVVAAASWRARSFLGVSGIADGASADLVLYARDPRNDISALEAPLHVILRGARVG